MSSKIRKTPIVCLLISISQLLVGRLRLSKRYFNNPIEMEDGKRFVIFRHITTHPTKQFDGECVFIVSFKFAHFSHKANKLASIIPMLVIAGSPGFIAKMYAVNPDDEYWQGMYQWESTEHLEDYKKSFVFRMMNKRAIQGTIKSIEIINNNLIEIIKTKRITM